MGPAPALKAHLPVLLLNPGLMQVVLPIARNVGDFEVLGLSHRCAPGVPPDPVVDRLRQECLIRGWGLFVVFGLPVYIFQYSHEVDSLGLELVNSDFVRQVLHYTSDGKAEVSTALNGSSIMEYLSDKIRILVTHQIQFIRKATQILVLSSEGRCLGLGSYDELQSQGIDFMAILKDVDREAEHDKQERELMRPFSNNSYDAKQTPTPNETLLTDSTDDGVRRHSRSTSVAQTKNFEVSDITGDEEDYSHEPRVQEENREVGSIGGHVYYEYFKAGAGPILFTITLFSTFISHTLLTDKNQKANVIDHDTRNYYVYIYSGLIGALFVTALMRSTTWFMMCMRASVNLHNSIFTRLLRAPIAVFDNNPVGQMLNRFSKDMGIVDEMLPTTGFDFNFSLFETIGIIITVATVNSLFETIGIIITVATVNVYLIIPGIFLIILMVIVRGIYMKSARDIKRFEGITRSPVFTHVSTTLNGLDSVRAYGAQEAFEHQYYIYQNDHTATWFLFACASRTLSLITDWICVAYLVAIAVVMMVFPEQIGNGGSAGLALSTALMMTGETQWGVKQSTEFESQMTSVE
ncbi:unnamed protein product, partial [Oppiella nova]